MSTNTEPPHNIEFPILSTSEQDNIKIYDLNKIFHFSYNFDLLKNLIESLIQNQTELQNEIFQLKNTNAISSSNNIQSQTSPEILQQNISSSVNDKNKNIKSDDQKKSSPLIPTILKPRKAGVVRSPPNDIKLEVDVNNDDVINKIIVSIY